MKLVTALNQFYYDMTLLELRLMKENTAYPSLTYNSLLYLDLISYKKNCTVSQLAELLHVSKSAVTIKVNELIKQGFVAKTQSDKDKRVFFLSLSSALAQNYKQYDNRLARSAAVLESHYNPKEIEMFSDMLSLIHKSYLQN